MPNTKSPRVALIVSHPIQHFCPMYASWAKSKDWTTKVFFVTNMGLKSYIDKDFGKSIAWNNLYLENFDHTFLTEDQSIQSAIKSVLPPLETELNTYNPDAVIIYGYNQGFQSYVLEWCKKHQKKILYISDSERAHKESNVRWWLKKIYYRSFFKQIDCFLSVGNYNELYYHWMGVPVQKMVRLGFSIDRQVYEQIYPKKMEFGVAIRAKYQIPDDHIIVSVVGKLIARKRQIDLVNALKILENTSNQRFTALIIGSGTDQEKIEQSANELTSNRAIVTGFVSPEDLPMYYLASDIYTHLSEYDPHTLAVGEAIYMGCPIVVSDTCGVYGPHDDVQIGQNGFTYPVGNVPVLAHFIKILGDNPTMRTRFGASSRSFAQESQSRSHDTGLKAALTLLGLLNN